MVPRDLEAVLFDAGGTLVHIDYAHVADVARRGGVAITQRALLEGEALARRAVDARAAQRGAVEGTDATRIEGYFAALLRGAGVAGERVAALVDEVLAAHAASNLWRVPLAGAAEALVALRGERLQTAVVSNGDGRVRDVLAGAGLAEHVAFVIDSFEEGVEKPDPEIFRRALARLGVPPGRAAYIGDIYSIDVVGARAAGLWPVLIDPTGGYEGSDCPTVASLGELVQVLGSGRAARSGSELGG